MVVGNGEDVGWVGFVLTFLYTTSILMASVRDVFFFSFLFFFFGANFWRAFFVCFSFL